MSDEQTNDVDVKCDVAYVQSINMEDHREELQEYLRRGYKITLSHYDNIKKELLVILTRYDNSGQNAFSDKVIADAAKREKKRIEMMETFKGLVENLTRVQESGKPDALLAQARDILKN